MDELTGMRDEIDSIDRNIITLLGQRFQMTEKIGRYKAENALAATDLVREASQFKQLKRLATELQLEESLVEKIYKCIIDEVVANHKRMIN
ncbi:MAG: chorismate mutase [Pseudomonadales bacterium]|nr:chorismate mutase [Pseudomonadales bacterium]NRA14329.1 chorismate mutase [Oceanospirillaceae bacterium]